MTRHVDYPAAFDDLMEVLFDEADYLAAFPDVIAAIARGDITSGRHHFDLSGKREIIEGRRRNIFALAVGWERAPEPERLDETGDDLFEELYEELNPDVGSARRTGRIRSAREHFDLVGHREYASGVRPTIAFPADAASPADRDQDRFDAAEYLYLHPDLRSVFRDADTAWTHWRTFGQAEGRAATGMPRRRRRSVSPAAMLAKPIGFNIYGPFLTQSGLGTAARALAKAVKHAGYDVDLWTISGVDAEIRPAAHHAERRPLYRINLMFANADQIAKLFAAYPADHFSDAFNIAVWQWELPSFRPDWHVQFDGIDEIWTNSTFQVDAIRTIAPVPVTKVHLPVARSATPIVADRAHFGLPEQAYIFFVSFDVGSTLERKNPMIALEAFQRLRRERDDVHLVVKYHASHGVGLQPVHDMVLRLGGTAGVTAIGACLTFLEMEQLRECCDCFVSPHRSEGFGLQIAEFMAAGKTVIATNYSGNTDFFDAQVGFPIDYRLREIEEGVGPYQAGFVWADPSEDDLYRVMTNVLQDPAEATARARLARARIEVQLGVSAVAASIRARVAALGFDQTIPPYLALMGASDAAVRSAPLDATRHVGAFPPGPLFSIVLHVSGVSAERVEQSIQSVFAQTHSVWELCVCGDACRDGSPLAALRGRSPRIKIIDAGHDKGAAAAINAAIQTAAGAFVVFLDGADLLAPDALATVTDALAARPALDVVYTDEDIIDETGRIVAARRNPDWSPERLESTMDVLHMLIVRKSLLLDLDGLRSAYDGAHLYDLMLRISRTGCGIAHLAEPLCLCRSAPGSEIDPSVTETGLKALTDHAVAKYGRSSDVVPGLVAGSYRIRRPTAESTSVTLIVMTDNTSLDVPGRGLVCLVENLVASILERTTYRRFEILIVDDAQLSRRQIDAFLESGCVVQHARRGKDGSDRSNRLNFAVRQARTDLVVILDEGLEVTNGDWLSNLLEFMNDPGIGAVGARLLNLDGTIRHVGIAVGADARTTHPYRSYPRDFVGDRGITHLIRNCSAVTGACLATRRSVVTRVRGFDRRFDRGYNDVDFCLKLQQDGLRVVYTPYAELTSLVSEPDGDEHAPDEIALFKAKWPALIGEDPFFGAPSTPDASERLLPAAE